MDSETGEQAASSSWSLRATQSTGSSRAGSSRAGASHSKASASKKVVMYRKYRVGELPDICVSVSDVIRPLQALCLLDSGIAGCVMGILFEGLYSTSFPSSGPSTSSDLIGANGERAGAARGAARVGARGGASSAAVTSSSTKRSTSEPQPSLPPPQLSLRSKLLRKGLRHMMMCITNCSSQDADTTHSNNSTRVSQGTVIDPQFAQSVVASVLVCIRKEDPRDSRLFSHPRLEDLLDVNHGFMTAVSADIFAGLCLPSLNFHAGIQLLEEQLLTLRRWHSECRASVLTVSTKKRKTGTTSDAVASEADRRAQAGAQTAASAATVQSFEKLQQAAWRQLSRLYETLGETDVFIGLVRTYARGTFFRTDVLRNEVVIPLLIHSHETGLPVYSRHVLLITSVY